MAAHPDAAAAFAAHIAGGERDIHQRCVGAVVVVAPDQALLVGEHGAPTLSLLGFGDPSCRLAYLVDCQTGDLGSLFQGCAVGGERLVEILGRGVDERLIYPAFVGDLGQPGVEQHHVRARVHGKVHDVFLARFRLGGVDRDRPSRIDEDDARLRMRLVGELGLLLVERGATQVRNPVVQEVVRLGFEGIVADRHQSVGELGVLIAIVQFADAHVTGRMDLRIVGGAVVDADILDLHGTEIELSGAPGIFVAAGRAAMVENGDEEPVLALFFDDRGSNARDQVERVIPRGRLHLAVAPDHRVGEALLLRAASGAIAKFAHARAAHGAEAGIHLALAIRLDDDVNVLAVLLDDVIHRGRIPGDRLGRLLFGEIDAEDVRRGIRPALLVNGPGVGVIAAADDAVVAGDIMLLGVRGNDRQTVDVTLVCHGPILLL